MKIIRYSHNEIDIQLTSVGIRAFGGVGGESKIIAHIYPHGNIPAGGYYVNVSGTAIHPLSIDGTDTCSTYDSSFWDKDCKNAIEIKDLLSDIDFKIEY